MKIARIVENPEVIGMLLKGKDKAAVKHYLYIKFQRRLMIEIANYVDLHLQLPTIIESASTKFNFIKYPIAWYALVRKFRPENVVETGVSMGWSSFMILTALERNQQGKLYSIDLNDSEPVKQQGGAGYMVPDGLKMRWDLILGDTHNELDPLLQRLGSIDMFIHDSDHSYQSMKFEYELAWKHLRKGGILASDDINHSEAFDEFIKTHEVDYHYSFQEIERQSDKENLRPQVGYCIKS